MSARILGIRENLCSLYRISLDILKEFVDKIPRTLLRITDQGRNALLDYTQNMKQVLDELA